MPLRTGNLYSGLAPHDAHHAHDAHDAQEQVEMLVDRGRVSVERIVSMGHASPAGFWYDDPRAEWVVLLSGAAALEFEHEAALHEMQPGDYVLIDAHCRHRVAWTHADQPTVWLAIYYEP